MVRTAASEQHSKEKDNRSAKAGFALSERSFVNPGETSKDYDLINDELIKTYQAVVKIVSGVAVGLGTLVLLGWMLNSPVLTALLPQWVPMAPNTAVGIIACGVALYLLLPDPAQERIIRYRLGKAVAVFVFLLGALTLVEYGFGVNLGIDDLVFEVPSDRLRPIQNPSRMAHVTAFAFTLFGLAFLLIDKRIQNRFFPAQGIAVLTFLISLLAITGYIFSVAELYTSPYYTIIAANTAILFLLISIAIFLLRPRIGLMAIVSSGSSGGIVIRQLFPLTIVMAIGLRALIWYGEQLGLYPPAFGIGLFLCLVILLFGVLCFRVAALLNRNDIEIRQSFDNLQKSQASLASTFNQAAVGIVNVAMDGTILQVNNKFCELVGYTKEELEGKVTFQQFVHPDDIKDSYKRMKELYDNDTEQYVVNRRYVCKSGSVIWVEASASLVRDASGKPLYVIGAVTDISQRKLAEERLKIINEELEQKVMDRTAQLQASNKELEAFASSVSHDLRAPLRSMDGFSKALLKGYGDQFDDKGKKYLQWIRESSQEMGELIDDLLHLSRVVRQDLTLEGVNLSRIAQNIIEDLQSEAPDREVKVEIAKDMEVQADKGLIKVLLQNLLGNAWKFSAKKELATIEFGSFEREGKTVFFVKDNGEGFDMKYVNKLFIPFQRLHSGKEFDGTGIGLTTVQRIIHKHGGEIWAESTPKQGATFFFTLE